MESGKLARTHKHQAIFHRATGEKLAFESLARPHDIRRCYEILLRRQPENMDVVEEWVARGATVSEVTRAIADSDEFFEMSRQAKAAFQRNATDPGLPEEAPKRLRAGPIRVLCFGAYGNGNLGDAAQGKAVAGLVQFAADRPVQVDLCSWLDNEPFPTGMGAIVAPLTIARRTSLETYDLLLIGGGGLLGTPHFPLLEKWWVDLIHRDLKLPYVLYGIAISPELVDLPETAPTLQYLLSGADWVGVRAPEIHPKIAEYAPHASVSLDPVLCREVLTGGGLDHSVISMKVRDIDVLFVPKFPVSHAEQEFFTAAASFTAEQAKAGRTVVKCILEPQLDTRNTLVSADAMAVSGWNQLQSLCNRARLVISMRYHGCIAALAAGTPTLGGGPLKINELLSAFSPHAYFVNDSTTLADIAAGLSRADDPTQLLAGLVVQATRDVRRLRNSLAMRG